MSLVAGVRAYPFFQLMTFSSAAPTAWRYLSAHASIASDESGL